MYIFTSVVLQKAQFIVELAVPWKAVISHANKCKSLNVAAETVQCEWRAQVLPVAYAKAAEWCSNWLWIKKNDLNWATKWP